MTVGASVSTESTAWRSSQSSRTAALTAVS